MNNDIWEEMDVDSEHRVPVMTEDMRVENAIRHAQARAAINFSDALDQLNVSLYVYL